MRKLIVATLFSIISLPSMADNCPTQQINKISGEWTGIMSEKNTAGETYKLVTTHRNIIDCNQFEVTHDYENLATGEKSSFHMQVAWSDAAQRFQSTSPVIQGYVDAMLDNIYSAQIDIVPAQLSCNEVIKSINRTTMERAVSCHKQNDTHDWVVEQHAIQFFQHP